MWKKDYVLSPSSVVIQLFLWNINHVIKDLNSILENLNKPFILYAGTLENYLFPVSREYTFESALRKILSKETGKKNIWEICDIACYKNEEWNKQANKGLKYSSNFKYVFKEEYVTKMEKIIKKWINDLEKIKREFAQEREREKEEKRKRKQAFEIIKIYSHINPKGGEQGTDGYFDAILKRKIDEKIVRVVARNVFDFGFYVFPKRVGGTSEVFSQEKWTELEKDACQYIKEFSPFSTNIRI